MKVITLLVKKTFSPPLSHKDMKPEILTQPNIPKPLHGLAPRTIMGQEWWDTERQKAYASTDYHCVACGVPKSEAKKFHWLEAHEYWKFDYRKGTAEVISIEPLCHYCHNFIHSGRLAMIMGKEKSVEEAEDILEHGFKLLAENKLQCFPFTLDLAKSIGANSDQRRRAHHDVEEGPDTHCAHEGTQPPGNRRGNIS